MEAPIAESAIMENITLFGNTFDKGYLFDWTDDKEPALYYFWQDHVQPQALADGGQAGNRLVRVRFDATWNEPKCAAFQAGTGVIIVVPTKLDSLLALKQKCAEVMNRQ